LSRCIGNSISKKDTGYHRIRFKTGKDDQKLEKEREQQEEEEREGRTFLKEPTHKRTSETGKPE